MGEAVSAAVPWGKQADEGARAYAAFVEYCGLGPARSLTALCRQLDRPEHYVTQLKRWSRAHGWVRRAEAFDVHRVESSRRATLGGVPGRAQQRAVDAVEEAVEILVELMRCDSSSAEVRVVAARAIVDAAGLTGATRPDGV